VDRYDSKTEANQNPEFFELINIDKNHNVTSTITNAVDRAKFAADMVSQGKNYFDYGDSSSWQRSVFIFRNRTLWDIPSSLRCSLPTMGD
jgi:hypothetical protein